MSRHALTDEELLRALRARVKGPSATPEAIADAEAALGFPLPPILRRVYETANGRLGPGRGLVPIGDGEHTLMRVYRANVDTDYAPAPDEVGAAQFPWPERLLPICDWGDAIWSCLDCRSDAGPIVTSSGGEPFASTGHTLCSWLEAWLAGTDLMSEMFEPGRSRTGINPFTKEPLVFRGHGKPKGAAWP